MTLKTKQGQDPRNAVSTVPVPGKGRDRIFFGFARDGVCYILSQYIYGNLL